MLCRQIVSIGERYDFPAHHRAPSKTKRGAVDGGVFGETQLDGVPCILSFRSLSHLPPINARFVAAISQVSARENRFDAEH